MKLEIPIVSAQTFQQTVHTAIKDWVNSGRGDLSKSLMRGSPPFNLENLSPFYKRWYGIIDLPNNIAVEINPKMFWIISGDDVMIYAEE